MLGVCLQLEEKITAPHHKSILEMKKDEYRHLFSNLLQNDEITPSYFYGVDKSLTIDAAAMESTRYDMSVHEAGEYHPPPYNTEIPEEAVKVILKFATYPDDYQDVLNEKFSNDEIHHLRFRFPALQHWLFYRRKYHSVAGSLYSVGDKSVRYF